MSASETVHAPTHRDYLDSPIRDDLYVLLSALLLHAPLDILIRQLSVLSWNDKMSPAMSASLDTLRTTAGSCSPETVQREFDDLFIGLGRGEVMPYASWYAQKLLMGAPLVRLRSDLAKMQISRRPKVCEPEDHAAALCETMALIIRNAEISLEQQTAFFYKHIHPWMIRFFKDLQRASSAHFYRAVGRLGEHFLRVENQHLQTI
jgi:TorA maturation chaperone TorD